MARGTDAAAGGKTTCRERRPAVWRSELVWLCAMALGAGGVGLALAQVGTNRDDFFAPGTQPGTLTSSLRSAMTNCASCHGYYDDENPIEREPFRPWAASMMGQSARDPIFHAALAIANQDASFAGEMCLRCHTPAGFQRGHTQDPSGAMLEGVDLEGVSCSVCHRAVDPVYRAGVSPLEDYSIIAGLPHPVPTQTLPSGHVVALSHNASLVLDPADRRRGPYELDVYPHQWLQSAYHRDSALCASCHDVSNPAYSRQPDGTYTLNPLQAPHPTGNKYDMFPVERTYSEWLHSSFAQGPQHLPMNPNALPGDPEYGLNRFGGNNPMVATCQDCHMPRTVGTGASPALGAALRMDLGNHFFNGANTWVLRAVRTIFPDEFETGLSPETVEESIARAQGMLAAASDMELSLTGGTLNVRLINQTGHKLPTGYPEGRRMWINVRFFDAGGALVGEHGAYDPASASLTHNTKIYEADLGLDAYAAALTGKPAGPSFHFALNNTYYKDNRIPPRGFTNAGFASVQALPVAAAYADGQYWDDTQFVLPAGAASALVRVYHQTTTKEYIEFLRDTNTTNSAGQLAYDQWVLHGKSQPTLMDSGTIVIPVGAACDSLDFNNDGIEQDPTDIEAFLSVYSGGPCVPATATCNDVDFNNDTIEQDPTDIESFLSVYSGGPCL